MPRRRRTRSPHPGVVLIRRRLKKKPGEKRGQIIGVRAKWVDPDTNQVVWETLDDSTMPNDETRLAWAKTKSEELLQRRRELAAGAPLRTETPIFTAIKDYLAASETRLRPRTRSAYEASLAQFSAWAAKHGLVNVEDVSTAHLAAFREAEISRRKKRIVKGGRRGEQSQTSEPRSPWTVNHVLRSVSTFLNYQRRLGRTPRMNRDAIAEVLEELRKPRPKPAPLPPDKCAALLRAALAHDRATFDLTRREHRLFPSASAMNRTRRYGPIAPFLSVVLLTGVRFGEASNLRWADVDLDALNERGEKVGEIQLRAAATKTDIERRVDLGVCPAVRTILEKLKRRVVPGEYVFGGAAPMSRHLAEASRRRLMSATYGAPAFDWQQLRCGV